MYERQVTRKLLASHIISAVLVLRTVIPPSDGFPQNVEEAIWIELSRLILLKALKLHVPGYREALGSIVVCELASNPWDRSMSLEEVFSLIVKNLCCISPILMNDVLREHAIEGDPTTWSILRREIVPEDTTTLLALVTDCMNALGIPASDREDVEEFALELYDGVFEKLAV
jgi:hypothetical protein